jgi:hypothetical protein
MWILIYIVIVNNSVTTSQVEFADSSTCLKTINQLVSLENVNLSVKAFCAKK